MKHTPGPWIAPKDQVNLVCRKADWECPHIGALAQGMQITTSLKNGEAQALADAQLIAAAPEMLEALEALLEACPASMTQIEKMYSDMFPTVGKPMFENMLNALNKASAAIAKAKGEI